MYFQLLRGVHLEEGTQYRAEFERDDQGQIKFVSQPIICSRIDLVDRFGPEKFRRLSEAEVKAIVKEAGDQEQETSGPTTPDESKVSKAAKKGAKEIAEPFGKDVTNRFDIAEDSALKVYRKSPRKHVVTSVQDGEEVPLTEEPISKAEVEKLIKEWSE